MSQVGVPEDCPPPEFQFHASGRPQLLGFRFPEVPGVPPLRNSPARRFKAAAAGGEGDPGCMPRDEWNSSLSTIAGEFDRADYHFSRFKETVDLLKARRAVAGGPVFGDPALARSAYCEAVGYLSAIRTGIDIIIYVAARRAGQSIVKAESWSATAAICPRDAQQQSKFATGDITALRQHRGWYETLNLYRNCMLHRGWHEQSFGYFSRGDTATEASDPQHNVMLVPDQSALEQRARPEAWTYRGRKWLDELLNEISSGARVVLEDLFQVWSVPDPAPGKIPIEEHPNVFLTVPLGRPLAGQVPPALHVFTSKKAGRAFLAHFRKHGREIGGAAFRAIRRMRLRDNGTGFLLAYDASVLGRSAELHVMDVRHDKPFRLHAEAFDPSTRMGPVDGTIWFRLPTFEGEVLYLLDSE